MHRFFIEKKDLRDNRIEVSGNEFNHLHRVLRLTSGDKIEICDGEENEFLAEIESIKKDRAICKMIKRLEYSGEPPVRVKLYQGLPKKDRLEFVIQKGVELGVDEFIPFAAKRSVVKLTSEKAEKRRIRWQKIALEAAKQSRRGRIPAVHKLLDFRSAVEKAVQENGNIIVPYVEENSISIKELLAKIEVELSCCTNKSLEYTKRPVVSIFIGPEGGFDPEEVSFLRKSGGVSVSLGPRILRTETAGIATATMVLFQIGDLGDK